MKFVKRILFFTALFVLIPVSAEAGDLGDRLVALFGGTTSAGSSEILTAEEAFQLSAQGSSGKDRLIVRWDIADGYYLYRDKFALATEDDDIRLREFSVPPGKLKSDPDFGQVEVNYR